MKVKTEKGEKVEGKKEEHGKGALQGGEETAGEGVVESWGIEVDAMRV